MNIKNIKKNIKINQFKVQIIVFTIAILGLIFMLKSCDKKNEKIDSYENEYIINETSREAETQKKHILNFYDEKLIEMRDNELKNVINSLYSTNTQSNYKNFDISLLSVRIASKKNWKDNITICGDSYAGLLYNYLGIDNISTREFMFPGQSIVENYDIYKKAINTDKPIIILSTSVNDVYRQTSLSTFKQVLESLFIEAYKKQKIIIMHSNVDFLYSGMNTNDSLIFAIPAKYYDEIVKRSAENFGNVFYVECNDIAKNESLYHDGIHYQESFYEILTERIEKTIEKIKNYN